MTREQERLDSALARLAALVRELPDNPGWERIAIVEDLVLAPEKRVRVRAAAIAEARAYRVRFAALTATGYPWLNLHAAGLLGGSTLLVTVERPPGGPTGAVPTSINISGPPNFVRYRPGWSVDDLLVQEGRS